MIQIDRQALVDFVRRQVSLVETTPLPKDLADEAPLDSDELTLDDLRAVWLGVASRPRSAEP